MLREITRLRELPRGGRPDRLDMLALRHPLNTPRLLGLLNTPHMLEPLHLFCRARRTSGEENKVRKRWEVWAVVVVAFVLAVGGVLVAARPTGEVQAGPSAAVPSASVPGGSASVVVERRWSRDQVREALPVAGDVGLDYQAMPVRRDSPTRSLVKSPGVPICNERGATVGGDLQEYLFWQPRTKTPSWVGNGFYAAGVTFTNAAEAGRAFDAVSAAVQGCPRTYEEKDLPDGDAMTDRRNSPGDSEQTWSPEPETVVDGWRVLRVVEVLAHPAAYKWQEPTVRKAIDYATNGNVLLVQLLWQWGPADGTDAWTKGRADALLKQTTGALANAGPPAVTTTPGSSGTAPDTQEPTPQEPMPIETSPPGSGRGSTPCVPEDGTGCGAA